MGDRKEKTMDFRTDSEILEELAARLRAVRLERSLSQEQLASKAGLSRDMVRSAESKGSITLTSLVKLLRVLDLLSEFDELARPAAYSPVAEFKKKKKERSRVYSPRGKLKSSTGRPSEKTSEKKTENRLAESDD